jgi:hypothetical protein
MKNNREESEAVKHEKDTPGTQTKQDLSAMDGMPIPFPQITRFHLLIKLQSPVS